VTGAHAGGAQAGAAAGAARSLPFQLRGNTYTMMVLKIVDPDDPSFFDHLATKIRQAPNFFRSAPVVLDLDGLDDPDFDFQALRAGLHELSLVAVGIQGGTPEMQQAALRGGLTVIPAARTPQPMTVARQRPESQPAPQAAPEPARPAQELQRTTLIVTEPVRSGRQVYAQGGDLVVLGPVSPGAELLADGNIHVYNALRGRALAGVGGDRHARVFAQSLQAELVSVAGYYRISDDVEPAMRGKAAQVWLDGEYIRIDPLA
jgi:septum site-determining protein MinC